MRRLLAPAFVTTLSLAGCGKTESPKPPEDTVNPPPPRETSTATAPTTPPRPHKPTRNPPGIVPDAATPPRPLD